MGDKSLISLIIGVILLSVGIGLAIFESIVSSQIKRKKGRLYERHLRMLEEYKAGLAEEEKENEAAFRRDVKEYADSFESENAYYGVISADISEREWFNAVVNELIGRGWRPSRPVQLNEIRHQDRHMHMAGRTPVFTDYEYTVDTLVQAMMRIDGKSNEKEKTI